MISNFIDNHFMVIVCLVFLPIYVWFTRYFSIGNPIKPGQNRTLRIAVVLGGGVLDMLLGCFLAGLICGGIQQEGWPTERVTQVGCVLGVILISGCVELAVAKYKWLTQQMKGGVQ